VLREFPPTPNLVNQQELTVLTSACYQPMADAGHSGSPSDLLLGEVVCVRDGSYDPLGTAARWHYAFDYSMPLHPGQDEIHGVICSTSRRQGTRSRRTFPSAISSTTWLSSRKFYPAVLADLNIYLLPVDVNTADVTQLTNAQTALESAAVMIQWLADSAALPGPADQDVIAASADLSVRFRISEDSVAMKGVDAVKITIALDAALPPRTGTPYVESPTPGYHCERASGADQNKFAFFYENADGNYLLASEAQKIPGRRFVLPDLDILERQDAQTEIYLTRNADLIPGKTIAEPFVYTTPQVSFENPLHPTLVNGDPVNLAAIFAAGENQPVRRTLQCQLSLLYEAVFANAGTDSVTLQVGLYYEYSINDALDRIRLPVYLMPPTSTAIREGGGGDKLADVIARQVQGWECWFKTYTPETKGGNLLFDLTVMSNLTQRPMPILRLTGLYLPFEYITPHWCPVERL
jgi:hypothetical protein